MTDRWSVRRIRELARDVHRPPPTPRDAIWARIEDRLAPRGERAGAGRERGVHRLERGRRAARGAGTPLPSVAWATAAAAALVLGLGIGRGTAPAVGPGSPDLVRSSIAPGGPPASGAPPPEEALDGVLARHLDRSESLLTLVRADAGSGRVDPAVGRWGRGLLLETRLLLDGSTGSDPALGDLLEDLELILAQVALLAGEGASDGSRGRQELRFIADGLEERDVLTRIRTVLSRSDSAIL